MDLRLLPFAAGLWLTTCGSLIIGSRQNIFYLTIWLVSLTLLSTALIRTKKLSLWNSTSLKFLVFGFIVGVLLAGFRLQPLIADPLRSAANQNAVIQVTGELISDPVRSKVTNSLDLATRDFGSFKFRANEIKFRDQSYKVRAPIQVFLLGENFTQAQFLPPGAELVLIGKFKASDSIRGVAGNLSLTEPFQIITPPPNYQVLATKFRVGLHNSLVGLDPDVAGLVPGLALGDTSQLTEQLAQDMKSAGLTHLTAVSGSNVSLLIALVIWGGQRLKLKTRSNYLIALLVLVAFVIVVRPQPSVLRASVMGVIMVIALLSRSTKSPIPTLIGSVIFLIFLDPWLAISYGFALSVCATAGLLLFAKTLLNSADELFPRQIPKWLLLGMVVTVSAQIAVFPILVGLGSPVSVGSLPANLISVPLAGPTMVFGILAALSAPVFFPLAQLFGWLAGFTASGIVFSARVFADQEWLVIPWPRGLIGVVLALLVVIGMVHARINWQKLAKPNQQKVIVTWAVLILLIWQRPLDTFRNWAPTNWQVASCDVGQGDATVIKVSQHQAVLVDVGGDPELIDRCLSQLKIRQIPLLLLTHFHADHVVGLPGALKDRQVGEIRISPLANPPLTTDFVRAVLREENIQAQVMAYPEYLKIGNLELFCIWPKRELGASSETPNNASVSLLIKSETLRLLLPGDIEEPAQEAIVQLIGDLTADVIKIPHHGSRKQSVEFAKKSKAQVAIVSAGAGNEYGHPAPETVFLYETLGARVIRTDLNGSIAIAKTDNGLVISAQK